MGANNSIVVEKSCIAVAGGRCQVDSAIIECAAGKASFGRGGAGEAAEVALRTNSIRWGGRFEKS